ncbi:speckle-type POZ protein-like protein, partial [Leptotrombidium deliense]
MNHRLYLKRVRTSESSVESSSDLNSVQCLRHESLNIKIENSRLRIEYSALLKGEVNSETSMPYFAHERCMFHAESCKSCDTNTLAVGIWCPLQSSENCLASYKLTLLDSNGAHYVTKFGYALFTKKYGKRRIDDFVDVEVFKAKNEGLRSDDLLQIDCQVRILCKDVPELRCGVESKSELAKGIANNFMSHQFCDVTFKVGSKQFEAHRIIMVSRSPVFLAMFSNDFKESKEQIVAIDDVDSDTFYELLKYIYTDSVCDIEKKALKLVSAAD